MCGIFGLILKPHTQYSRNSIKKVINKIAILSESRGKDSSGVALQNDEEQVVHVVKGDISISALLKSNEFNQEFNGSINSYENGKGFIAFGHARLVTNGSQLQEVNNQPVIKDNSIIIHNGIIVNVNELWAKNTDLRRDYLIDTEILPALVMKNLQNYNDLTIASDEAFKELTGTFSIAMLFAGLDIFILATNNGSLYYLTDNQSYLLFASEEYFLKMLLKEYGIRKFINKTKIQQLMSGKTLLLNTRTFKFGLHTFGEKDEPYFISMGNSVYVIQKHILENKDTHKEVVIDPAIFINRKNENHLSRLLESNTEAISKLKRCTKCILPETFPFITFDQKGVCNYCNNYKPKMNTKSILQFKEIISHYKCKNGNPDCIVPFSGGRDSTYTLHTAKRELGLNPIAFTYDWGMVTDLARRNIARVCGKLGVENIIISANIHWKRENIRKNILAWLKYPTLGMIPLFMAGDKFFFYYTNQVKKQTGIDLNIWGINPLENTEFKVGFTGVPPNFYKEKIYSLSAMSQLKLFAFVGNNVLKSPSYLNQSVLDSLGSFAARYIAPKKDYYHLFDYYRWDENEINELIKYEYKWETAIDTKSTWRIGDGTASFYNYIYYTVAGFSEIDTFRSNQIREGMIIRENAIKLVEEENLPRYETLRWYLEIVGVDFELVIKTINTIPKLYPI